MNWAELPSEAALFPIVAEGQVVALLYADNLATGVAIAETEGLEIFISQAGLALRRLCCSEGSRKWRRKGFAMISVEIFFELSDKISYAKREVL